MRLCTLLTPGQIPGTYNPDLPIYMFQCYMGGADRTVSYRGVLRVGMKDNLAVNC